MKTTASTGAKPIGFRSVTTQGGDVVKAAIYDLSKLKFDAAPEAELGMGSHGYELRGKLTPSHHVRIRLIDDPPATVIASTHYNRDPNEGNTIPAAGYGDPEAVRPLFPEEMQALAKVLFNMAKTQPAYAEALGRLLPSLPANERAQFTERVAPAGAPKLDAAGGNHLPGSLNLDGKK